MYIYICRTNINIIQFAFIGELLYLYLPGGETSGEDERKEGSSFVIDDQKVEKWWSSLKTLMSIKTTRRERERGVKKMG